jgi:hypothetical protein
MGGAFAPNIDCPVDDGALSNNDPVFAGASPKPEVNENPDP